MLVAQQQINDDDEHIPDVIGILNGARGCVSSPTLHHYQLAVAYWLLTHPDQKGLLVTVGTGLGKTFLAANVAEAMRRAGLIDYIIILVPVSVQAGFTSTINKCTGNKTDQYLIQSVNTWANADNPETLIPSRWRRDFQWNRAMLVIDEAHKLRNKKTKMFKRCYETARKCKHVLLMTATPFINKISDADALFRLTTDGRIRLTDRIGDIDKITDQKELDNVINNLSMLIPQEVAYWHAVVDTKPRVNVVYNTVAMSYAQYGAIQAVFNGDKTNPILQRLMGMGKIKTELNIDNMRGILNELRGQRNIHAAIENLRPANLTKLQAFLTIPRELSNTILDDNTCDPKITAMLTSAINGPKPCIIYSTFISFGIEKVYMCLVEMIHRLNPHLSKDVIKRRIVVFTGAQKGSERGRIVEKYNKGEYDYMLFSSAGAVGISLKHTRQVHILEPSWNPSEENQARDRAIRIDSHIDMPYDQRSVDVIYWKSIRPNGVRQENEMLTPDVYVASISAKKSAVIDAAMKAFENASIPMTGPDILTYYEMTGQGNNYPLLPAYVQAMEDADKKEPDVVLVIDDDDGGAVDENENEIIEIEDDIKQQQPDTIDLLDYSDNDVIVIDDEDDDKMNIEPVALVKEEISPIEQLHMDMALIGNNDNPVNAHENILHQEHEEIPRVSKKRRRRQRIQDLESDDEDVNANNRPVRRRNNIELENVNANDDMLIDDDADGGGGNEDEHVLDDINPWIRQQPQQYEQPLMQAIAERIQHREHEGEGDEYGENEINEREQRDLMAEAIRAQDERRNRERNRLGYDPNAFGRSLRY